MKKIPTLFARDWNGNPKHITREINPECAWVLNGEGTPTVKWDGTCVMLDDRGHWWARREVKPGKTPPPGFVEISLDEATGKVTGWEPVEQSGFARWHAEALAQSSHEFAAGTYELLGPKINGNPDHFAGHILIRHGWAPLNIREDVKTAPRDYDGLAEWLRARDYEGLVFHHPDGERFAKIKRRDFPAARFGDDRG